VTLRITSLLLLVLIDNLRWLRSKLQLSLADRYTSRLEAARLSSLRPLANEYGVGLRLV